MTSYQPRNKLKSDPPRNMSGVPKKHNEIKYIILNKIGRIIFNDEKTGQKESHSVQG